MKKIERKIKFITGTKGRDAFNKACKDIIQSNKDLEFTKKFIKQQIDAYWEEEFRKCKVDVNYFINKYVIINKKSDK